MHRVPDDLACLRLLARSLLGRELLVQPVGLARPVLTTTHLLLPEALLAANDHGPMRAAMAHAVAHVRFSSAATPSAGLKPMTIALMSTLEDARVERLMLRDQPGMRDWFLPLLRRAVQPDGVDFAALMSRLDLALMDPHHDDAHHWIGKARTLFDRQARLDLGDADRFRQLARLLVHDLGQTRVAFRPGQYQVGAAYRDDHSFLWHHAAAPADPPEMALHVPLPSQTASQSLQAPRDGQPLAVTVAEVALARHLYPEWDHHLLRLREDWCTVVEKLPPWRHAPRPVPATDVALGLKSAARRRVGPRWRRQPDGDELDLNAVVAFRVERRAGGLAEARVFTRPGASERQASILVLLDLSASANDPLGDGTHTFLSLQKNAALLLAQAMQARGDRIAVHGFSSNTRHEVSHYRLLDFGAPLNGPARALIDAAPARHSTRLGAALRHATACLSDETAALKAILVLSDGAPSDIDVHRPRHLVEDARHAVQSARSMGVQVQGLIVDRQAEPHARRIFGWGHCQIVDQASAAPARLCGLYRGLVAA